MIGVADPYRSTMWVGCDANMSTRVARWRKSLPRSGASRTPCDVHCCATESRSTPIPEAADRRSTTRGFDCGTNATAQLWARWLPNPVTTRRRSTVISPRSACGTAHRAPIAGAPLARCTPFEGDRLRHRHVDDRRTIVQIGVETGISTTTVHRAIERYGLVGLRRVRRPGGWRPASRDHEATRCGVSG